MSVRKLGPARTMDLPDAQKKAQNVGQQFVDLVERAPGACSTKQLGKHFKLKKFLSSSVISNSAL